MNKADTAIAEITKTAKELATLYGINYKTAKKQLIRKAKKHFKDLDIRQTKDGNTLGLRQRMAKVPTPWIG